MGIAGQVDGLAGALLCIAEEPDRVAVLQKLLDRYGHRLRNRLNSIKLSLYLARRLAGDDLGPEWGRADAEYRTMEATIEQIQRFCLPARALPSDGDLGGWIEGRLDDWRRRLADRRIRLEADGPGEPLLCRADWARLGQAIDLVVAAWAAKGPPDATIRVAWGRDPDSVRIRFEHDGDGGLMLPRGEPERLALPLLARVLHAHQGSLGIPENANALELIWPAEPAATSVEATR